MCINNYLILSNNLSKNPYTLTKNNIKNGSIISYEVNDRLIEELPIIINYIKTKGYKIVNLDSLIKE